MKHQLAKSPKLPGIRLVLLCLTLTACATSPAEDAVFVHENFDLANYTRVAVLPLENLTGDRFAAERVRELLSVELAAQGPFDVVEPGEVNRVLRQQGLADAVAIGPAETAALGTALNAQALFVGTVMDFEERRTGSVSLPEVALSLRMLDAETGIQVWAVTGARSSAKWSTRLFGVGEETQTDAVLRVVRKALRTLE
ncbi:MAG: DUF799 family lipoprotein [Planctomycetota bacterium]|nr:DUF799 family lipoprotein [Planctomycetota bacterium]